MANLTPDDRERLALIGEMMAIADLCADAWLRGADADPRLLRQQRIVTRRLLELSRTKEAPAPTD